MKAQILSLLTVFSLSGVYSQSLVSVTPLNDYSVSAVQSAVTSEGWSTANLLINPVKSYKITYNTTDAHGNNTVASGAVYIPQLSCSSAPLLVYEHGTEFVKTNVPSTGAYADRGIYFSTSGYIAVLPDYLGLGDNQGIHLYQHAETEATATVDLLRAVREYLDTATNIPADNGELYVTGYSHGGHSAMATLKYIQDNNLQNEFNVIATAPLSGAYDMVKAQYDMIFDGDSNYYASPFLPYILASFQEAYGNVYQNYSDIYDSPYDANIENYLLAGTHTGFEWYFMLGGGNYYNFMQDSVLQNMLGDVNRDTHPINIALRENSLYNWVPQTPVKMLYCGSDSMVSPNNARYTLDSMVNLGATQVEALNLNNNADHNGCFLPATAYALTWFDSLATKCSYAGIEDVDLIKVEVYPNPTSQFLKFKGLEDDSDLSVRLLSISGAVLFQERLRNNILDVEILENGFYYVELLDDNNLPVHQIKFIKQ